MNDKELLIESLDPIIADLLYKKILESKSQMAEALAPVMGSAIRKQIAEAKDDMADALYPVIGQAVRKSVAEAIKSLMQTINERIDNIVSQGFRSRKKIDRELILRESLPFHLQEIFLIHKKTGLLLSHASYNQDNSGNEDVISGMLSAIKEFSKAAFSTSGQGLHEIQYEDLNIIIEDGKYAYLAFVVKGVPTLNFKEIVKALESKIHLRFYKDMRGFNGETNAFVPVNGLLSGFITSVHEPLFKAALMQANSKKGKPKGAYYLLALILIIVLIIFFFPTNDNLGERYAAVVDSYQNRPGSFFSGSLIEKEVVLKGSIFKSDRDNLIAGLENLGLGVESEGLFILPDIKNMQGILLDIQNELNLKSALSVVVDSTHLSLHGVVPDQSKSLLAVRLFAGKSLLPVILNEITVRTDEHVFDISEVNKFVVYFEPSFSELKNQSLQILDSVLIVLHNTAFSKISIMGFADSTGPMPINKQIAQKRADAVQKYLIENNVPIQKIETTSFVLENNPETRKFKSNRRVNFKAE